MKLVFILFLFIAGFTSCTEGIKDGSETRAAAKDRRNPANEIEVNIYRCGDSMMQAFKTKDWKIFAQYNHPAMLKMMGGEEAFENLLASQMKDIPDTAIKTIGVGKILQVIKTEQDYQCVIEQNMLMEMEGMRINSTTYLIGESLNGGRNWTFFDASSEGLIKPTDVKPNLSPELKVPQKKQDVKPVK